ncbi:MAG: DUF4235 domain-containing protein [Solirubrobacterales bacterium]|nr:DUF4235 domain-containing protein [Solirubrobacterales bacterium]
MKAVFLPLSVLAGVAAGLLSKRLFALAWRLIDDGDAPSPKQRVEDHSKLAAALVLQGAISGAVRGGVDHASRHGFARLTGAWPGEEPS